MVAPVRDNDRIRLIDWITEPPRIGGRVAELPTGTVTFLFSDLEGSTRLFEDHPAAMHAVIARHDELLRNAVESHGGYVVKFTGDGVHAAFASARAAADAAIAARHAIADEPWSDGLDVRVRIGLHAGEAVLREGDHFGSEVNRAARIMSVAHGGQIVCSRTVAELVSSAATILALQRSMALLMLWQASQGIRIPQKIDTGIDLITADNVDAVLAAYRPI